MDSGLRALIAAACEQAQRLQVLIAAHLGAARRPSSFLEVCLKEERPGAVLEPSSQRARIVQFEYSSTWAKMSPARTLQAWLQGVVTRLESFGYHCFWDGKHGIVRVHPATCSHGSFWSNVVCAAENDLRHKLGQLVL